MCSLLEAAKAREFVSKAEDIITMENDKEKEKRKRRKQTVGWNLFLEFFFLPSFLSLLEKVLFEISRCSFLLYKIIDFTISV